MSPRLRSSEPAASIKLFLYGFRWTSAMGVSSSAASSSTASAVSNLPLRHPLDTLKVRMQTSLSTANPKTAGLLGVIREILAKEGIAGLYAGAASPLLGAMAHNATKFFSYGMAKQVVGGGKELTVPQYYLAGSLAAIPVSIVETPVDLFKIQMQVPKPEYAGVIDCGQKIFRRYGIVGVYQGLGATLLRNVPCFGAYFFSFEGTKVALTKKGEKPSLPVCFVAGASAGAGFWGIFYPLETIKSRIQGDHVDPAKRVYTGIIDCARKTAAKGWGTFYRGFAPSLLRAIPVNGAILTGFTATQRALK